MSLRTSLARLTRRDPDTPSLRDRLAATKVKAVDIKHRAAKAVKVGRIVFQPLPPEPDPVDRLALINYATWLATERRLLCHEIYPNAGPGADRTVIVNVAADRFHFPHEGRWQDVPQPSTRAVQTLDRLGIDWRGDEDQRADLAPRSREGEAVEPMPYGWPQTDGMLLAALADMLRADDMMAAIQPVGDREADELPSGARWTTCGTRRPARWQAGAPTACRVFRRRPGRSSRMG